MRQNLKSLWKGIQDTEPIIWIAYAMGILFIGGLVLMAQGCALVEALTGTADKVNDTLEAVDTDGSGTISMQEILQYCLYGWLGGRVTETAGKLGVKKFRHGRKQSGDRTNEHCSSSDPAH